MLLFLLPSLLRPRPPSFFALLPGLPSCFAQLPLWLLLLLPRLLSFAAWLPRLPSLAALLLFWLLLGLPFRLVALLLLLRWRFRVAAFALLAFPIAAGGPIWFFFPSSFSILSDYIF